MRLFVLVFFAIGFVFSSVKAGAFSIDWAGTYRFEYVTVNRSYLTTHPIGQASDGGEKNYFLSHLNLSPKIIATDGVNIVANFEIFNSQFYPGSQVGSDFGWSSPHSTVEGTVYPVASPSGNVAQGQGPNPVEVNQLYATWGHEYGEVVVGRVPVHFGLGMTHNAGTGLFDHWLETHDLIGYKFLIGNLSLMPMYGRNYRSFSYAGGGYSTELMFNLDYASSESDSAAAVLHQSRTAGMGANDASAYFAPYDSTGSPLVASGYSTTLTSLYFAKGWESFKLKLEAAFQGGSTGVRYKRYQPQAGFQEQQGVSSIDLGGFGLVVEMSFPTQSPWQWSLRGGTATGDNLLTQNYEGFSFNKNYNVAMLLFRHPLGQNGYNVLTNQLDRQRDANNKVYSNDRVVDEASISNATYLSPKLDYIFNNEFELSNSVTYAVTQTNPSAVHVETASGLGLEWDIGLVYKFSKRFNWVNQIGLFYPGAAFNEGNARSADFTYGIESKIAIGF